MVELEANPSIGVNEYLAASLRKQWKRYRKKLKCCQREFSQSAVHESRVETRRLISIVDLLGAFLADGPVRKTRRILKRHLDRFDELRDTHVQLLSLAKMLRIFPVLQPFHAALEEQERRAVKSTARRIKRIKAARLARLVAALAKGLEEAPKPGAHRRSGPTRLLQAVNWAFTRVVELRRSIDPRDTATIHRTRVAFKNFRYMVEALAPLFPGVSPRQFQAMKEYQSMMGDIQDNEVLLASFAAFRRKRRISPDSAGRFEEELLRRHQWLISAYLQNADHLFEFWPSSHRPRKAPRQTTRRKAA